MAAELLFPDVFHMHHQALTRRGFHCVNVLRTMLSVTLIAATATRAAAQEPARNPVAASDNAKAIDLRLGAQATIVRTTVSPAIAGRTISENYLSSPVIVGHASMFHGRLSGMLELNLEGQTMRNGEPTPGIFGEGFVDRRHPHTYVHEAIVTAAGSHSGWEASLTAGKGFAPFGTDDPMSRPLQKFPVNHHLAQLLERGNLVAAIANRWLITEGAIFNGDEPSVPRDMPNWKRFGDSWTVRSTLLAGNTTYGRAELQVSHSQVKSPEFREGNGVDQVKWSSSIRYENPALALKPYALIEWADTREFDRDEPTFQYWTVLGEGAAVWKTVQLGVRFERTVRPEHERLLDRFRTQRPPHDFNLIGLTRWDVSTVRVGRRGVIGALSAEPFVEVASSRPTAVAWPTVFEPDLFYGSSRLWTFTLGLRLDIGARHGRMGRYGVAQVTHEANALHHDH